MTSSQVTRALVALAIATVLVLGSVAIIARALAPAQVLTWADIYADSTFVLNGTCPGSSRRAPNRGDFMACVQNNGQCPGANNYRVLRSDEAYACRVTIIAHNEAFSGSGVGTSTRKCVGSDCTGTTTGASPYTYTSTHTALISTQYPFSYNVTRSTTDDSGAQCTVTIKDNGVVIASTVVTQGQSATGTYTASLSGAPITVTVNVTNNAPGMDSGYTCTVSGGITYYY